MKIIVTHSSGFDFKKELYEPIRSSTLNTEYDFYLPQETGAEKITDDAIKNSNLVFAEVSYPSTGQGIELGWANIFKIPIVCFYKSGTRYSSALGYITTNFIEYSNEKDLLEKLESFLSNF